MGRGKNALRITSLQKALELIDFQLELIQFKSNNQNPVDKNPQLTRLFEYLEKRYAEKITAKEVYDYMYMSEDTLSRFLKKETGMTLMPLIYQIRIKHAKNLLVTTSETIGSIGYTVGFGSESAFCKVFKREMNITPLMYRQKRVKC